MGASTKVKENTRELGFRSLLRTYSPMTLSDYLERVKETSEHSKLVEEGQINDGSAPKEVEQVINSCSDNISSNLHESSPERLYRILSANRQMNGGAVADYPFFRNGDHSVKGLSDVLDSLANRVYQASLLYQKDQIPLILLVGPTGSGKTQIGRRLDDGFIEDLGVTPKYTFQFIENGPARKRCPIQEEPLHLVTSKKALVPSVVRKQYSAFLLGELCPSCSDSFASVLIDTAKRNGENGDLETSEEPNFSATLDGIVEVVRVLPKTSVVELADKKFHEKFVDVVRNSNRGILHITIDDRDLNSVPDNNYQLLLNLADKRVPLADGSFITPDLTVLLYGNENILKDIIARPAFKDRILPVFVRRNLSFSEEEKIYSEANIPYGHFSPSLLSLVSKFAVGTRINLEDDADLEYLIDLYERFDTNKSLKDDELKMIKQRLRINSFDAPIDGWSEGFSARRMISDLHALRRTSKVPCFTLDILIKYLDLPDKGDYEQPVGLVMDQIEEIVRRDITLSYLSVIYENEGGINYVEGLFSRYLTLIRDKELNNKSIVNVPGKGKISIDEEINYTLDKMHITEKSEFKEAVDELYNNSNATPSFMDLMADYPYLIGGSDNLSEYIEWDSYAKGAGLVPQSEARVKELLGALKQRGYCEHCGESALKYYARELQ